MTVTTGRGWRLEVLGEKRWWLVIDDPWSGTLQGGGLLEGVELPPGAVVVVSRLHPDDELAGVPERVEAQLVGDGLVDDYARAFDDLRLALRNEPMRGFLPAVRGEPVERPWLDQRLCRPRKLKRWRGKR